MIYVIITLSLMANAVAVVFLYLFARSINHKHDHLAQNFINYADANGLVLKALVNGQQVRVLENPKEVN